jgi:MGT family glycosyltransferase
MSHIAFFNAPAPGHLMPTLAVVEELVRRGHRVTYPATEAHAQEIASTGATVPVYSSTIDVQRDFPPGIDNWLAKLLLTSARESAAITPALEAMFADDLPDVVVYDGFVRFVGEVFSEKWHRPSVRLFPVGCVSQHVTRQIGDQAYDELVAALDRLAAMHGVDPQVAFHGLRGDPDALKIVFYPSRFGYVDAATDDRFVFVGPCFRRRELSGDWRPPDSGFPVVLISMGTTFNLQPEFFRLCVKAFTGRPWHVVLALGPGSDLGQLGPLPPNVEAHEWIPFQPVLRHAAVSVCIAGTGSVMHALYEGTPLVVVPQLEATEGLVGQVRDFGLARIVRPEELTPDRLRDAVADVAADESVRRNVLDMQRHVREAGGASRAADEILAHLGRSTKGER